MNTNKSDSGLNFSTLKQRNTRWRTMAYIAVHIPSAAARACVLLSISTTRFRTGARSHEDRDTAFEKEKRAAG